MRYLCAVSMIAEYRRRTPEAESPEAPSQRARRGNTLLHRIVRENLNTFLALADARAGEGRSLPKYVREEFRRFVDCGILAKGFIRLHCPTCRHDELLAFS